MGEGDQKVTNSDSYKLREENNKKCMLDVLNDNKRGLTIKDIADKTGFSRETISKHLQALEYENEIYTQKFGNVLVAYPNHKKVRDKDVLRIDAGSRAIFLNRLENEFGEYILISETRKTENGWEKKGSVLIPPDKVKELVAKLSDMEERAKRILKEES